MDKKNGWHEIIKNAVVAAYKRSKSLAKNWNEINKGIYIEFYWF